MSLKKSIMMLRHTNLPHSHRIMIQKKCNQVASTRLHDFSILTTNIESLNAKFDEVVVQISELNKINFKYNVICLQETWLSETDDMSIFIIYGYNCISQG